MMSGSDSLACRLRYRPALGFQTAAVSTTDKSKLFLFPHDLISISTSFSGPVFLILYTEHKPCDHASMNEQNHAIIKRQSCLVCGSKHVDVAHIKTKGSGGSYALWNLMPLCRVHHTEQHKIGLITFSQKYIGVATHLIENGWDLINGKLLHIQDDQIAFRGLDEPR